MRSISKRRFWTSIVILYILALLQGITFVTVPAASNFLISADGFSFSPSEYGTLFIPMIIGAVLMSILGSRAAKKWGIKNLTTLAFILNLISMILMTSTKYIQTDPSVSLPTFWVLMFFLGSGFGLSISLLSVYIVTLFPNKSSTALTCLHSLLGIGTAVSPKLFSYFHSEGNWWLDPLILSIAFFTSIILFISIIPKNISPEESDTKASQVCKKAKGRALYLAFACTLLFYGICETAFGNWGVIYLHQERHFSALIANDALSIFWGCVTVGRLVSAFLTLFIAPIKVFITLPCLIILAFFGVDYFARSENLALISFAFAGIACSSFFPLGISLATTRLKSQAEKTSGMMVGLYLLGYGITAEGMGVLSQYFHIELGSIFLSTSLVALVMLILNIYVSRKLKKDLKEFSNEGV